ncbi:hypothetical protein GON01_15505 [Sphingomonas sp. MAH-20]|uniref:Lipoprotein n=1 Tax=Sphingomonas horti TaxID=2682842 RepID=A0A6I4J3V0_9SPHN|nr:MULTISPECIES: hypothetical protein [Sphingomonas]MBA2921097.1 hypothetical protein [Sphingomonas sp. CGMCC 1.13658]MVO79339.1 hypothetical protein [Sphingomonas horti]
MRYAVPALALLALAACSDNSTNGSTADAQADALDNAADQSTAKAADVLENRADAIRENGAIGAPGAPGSSTQNAVNAAAEAQDNVRQAPVPGPKPTK